MAEAAATTPEYRGYENPSALYESLSDALQQERQKSFPPAFTTYLKEQYPALYAELCAADDAQESQEVGPYTKDQLEEVEKDLLSYTTDKYVEMMQASGVNAEKPISYYDNNNRFNLVLNGTYRLHFVQNGKADWTLNGLAYHTSAEEVFEDAADMQRFARYIQDGTWTSEQDSPFTMTASGAVLFDMQSTTTGNTFEVDDSQALLDALNKMYQDIKNGVPQGAPVADAREAGPTVTEAEKQAVRDAVKARPETVMEGDKKSFKFKVGKNSKEDLYARIQDIYSTEDDRKQTLTSDRFPGKDFKYDASRASFYEFKDAAFTKQRLVIRAGDKIGTREPIAAATPTVPEPAPVVTPKTPEAAPALSEKDSEALLASLHELRVSAEAQLRALEGAEETRAMNPQGWEKLDGTYRTMAILFETKGFDLSKVPTGTPYLEEIQALKAQLPRRMAVLGVPIQSPRPEPTQAVAQKETTDGKGTAA